MRILVTGATGFLGRNLASSLTRSHQVFGVTRGGALAHGIEPLIADLAGPFSTSTWPTVDAVVHLAQSARYAEFPAGANEVFAIAAQATQLLLDYAVRCGARRFVFASTGGLYRPSAAPFRETDPIEIGSGGMSHYFASKRSGELLAMAYAKALSTTSARIFFCYGPDQRPPLLLPRLARRLRDGAPITLQGETGTIINPVHVDDAVAAFTALLGGGPPVVNVAGPRAVTLREICDALARGLGAHPTYAPDLSAEPPRLVADIALMATEVWKPTIDPIDGVVAAADTLARA